jgi:hypothetical protein
MKRSLHCNFITTYTGLPRSLNIDDSITTIYNNNVEFRFCLIKSKLDFLKTSISRSFVVYDVFFYLPCKNFLISITEDASENAETIDFISKSLEQAKGTENYENEIPEVQKRWNELFLTTKEVLSFLYQS